MFRLSLFVRLAVVFVALGCAHSAESSDEPERKGGNNNSSKGDGGAKADAGDASAEDASDGEAGDASKDAPSCQGVVCQSPPSNVCEDASTVRVYEGEGECKAGYCEYPSSNVPCPFGCVSGACEGNPCEGIVCNGPPKNECVDGTTLKAYDPNGSCGTGGCTYSHTLLTCPKGCAGGACKDDLCVGVICSTPPPNKCQGTSHLIVHATNGQCKENGECAYSQTFKACEWGCVDDACNGDPCDGKACNTPDANHCLGDGKTLVTYAATGTCEGNGVCKYERTEQTCPHGCDSAIGACKKDPCIGVSCNTPAADRCDAEGNLVVRVLPGTCNASTGHVCKYTETIVPCPNCVDGVCKDCAIDDDCAGGAYCSADDSCKSCDTDQHCGDACVDCTATSQVCNAEAGACVDCMRDSQCGPGAHCDGGSCSSCDTKDHCGPSCSPCSGTTPVCGGSACVCSGDSCGPGAKCTGGACVSCGSDSACGPSCSPCGGSTPRCLGTGAAASCVECVSDGDCTGDKKCDAATHSCKAPVVECSACGVTNNGCQSSSSGNRKGCGNAWVIGRDAFAGGGTYEAPDVDLTANAGQYVTPNCLNAGSDNAFRVFLFAGEEATATMTKRSGDFTPSVRFLFNGKNWNGSSCGTAQTGCASGSGSTHTVSVVASQDGWYVLSAGAAAYDKQKGKYDLSVKVSNCRCGC